MVCYIQSGMSCRYRSKVYLPRYNLLYRAFFFDPSMHSDTYLCILHTYCMVEFYRERFWNLKMQWFINILLKILYDTISYLTPKWCDIHDKNCSKCFPYICRYGIMGIFGRLINLWAFGKKVWRINRSAKRLSIVNIAISHQLYPINGIKYRNFLPTSIWKFWLPNICKLHNGWWHSKALSRVKYGWIVEQNIRKESSFSGWQHFMALISFMFEELFVI